LVIGVGISQPGRTKLQIEKKHYFTAASVVRLAVTEAEHVLRAAAAAAARRA